MAKLSVLLLLLVACLFALSHAAPMEDISETDIDITETLISPTKESFLVQVTRVDDLVSDDGELLAERLESVMIEFELDDDQLLINNVPVELGVTGIAIIEAQIVNSPVNGSLSVQEIENLEEKFDIGLVTVEVTSIAESFPTEDPTILLRRINITTRIMEIDGVDILQSDLTETILEVKALNVLDDDTESLELAPTTADAYASPLDEANDHAPCSLDRLGGRFRHWWRCSSRFTRVIIASIFLTSIFGLIFIALPTAAHALILAARRRHGAYQQVAIAEEERTASKNDQIIYIADEEKRALMTDQENKQ